jgi:MFS family permease
MDERHHERYARMALAAILIGYVAPSYAQYQLSPLGPSLMEGLGITASQFSSLFTAPMLPAILFSLVAGILVDKANPRLVLGTTFVISTIGALLNLIGFSYGMLFLGFALTGVVGAFLNSCGAKLLGGWYAPEEVPQKLGLGFAFSTLGMTVALATTAYFPDRHAAFAMALAVYVVALVCWFALYHNPVPSGDSTSKGHAARPGLSQLLKRVMGNAGVWLCGLSLFCIMAANVVMGSLMPTALATRGIDSTAAGYYTSAYTIGSLVACIVAPRVAKRWGTKRTVAVLSLAAAVLVAIGWKAPAGAPLMASMFGAGMFVGGNMPLLMSVPITLDGIGPELAGTAGGLVATVELIGAVLLPSHVLIPLAGDDLGMVFVLAGVCMVIACVFDLLVPTPKTYGKPVAA